MTSVLSYGVQQSLMNAYKAMLQTGTQTPDLPKSEDGLDPAQAFQEVIAEKFGGSKPPERPLNAYQTYTLGLTERETPSEAAGIYGRAQNLSAAEPEATRTQPAEMENPDPAPASPYAQRDMKAILLQDGKPFDNTGERWDVMVGNERVATVWSDGSIRLAMTKPGLAATEPDLAMTESSYEYHTLGNGLLPAWGEDKSLAGYAQLLAGRVGGTVQWSKAPEDSPSSQREAIIDEVRWRYTQKEGLLERYNADGTAKDLQQAIVKVDGQTVARVFETGRTFYLMGSTNPDVATIKNSHIADLPQPESGLDEAKAHAEKLAERLGGTIEWAKVADPGPLYRHQAELLGLPNLDSYPMRPETPWIVNPFDPRYSKTA